MLSNVIVQADAALPSSSTCLLSASQPICAKKSNPFQNEVVLQFKRRTEPNRFENTPRLIKFAKRAG